MMTSSVISARDSQESSDMESSELNKHFLNDVISLLPLPLPELVEHFEKFKACSQQILEKFHSKFDSQSAIMEIESDIVNKRVFELAESENAYKLEELAQEKIREFIKIFPFQQESDFVVISDYLKDRILGTDDVLQEIITQRIGVKERPFIPDFQKINQIVDTCFRTAELFRMRLFEKYQIREQILSKKEQAHFLCTHIYQRFKENYRGCEKYLSRKMLKCLAKCETAVTQKRAKATKSDSSASYGIEEYKAESQQLFLQFIVDELKFEPCQVFTWHGLQQIEKTADYLYEDLIELKEDLELFKKFSSIFESYYKTRAINIFDQRFDPECLFTIVHILLLTEYEIHDEATWREFCYPKLKTLVHDFLYPKIDKPAREQIEEVLELIQCPEENRNKLNSLLVKELAKWNKIAGDSENDIFDLTLFSIFVYFSNSMREETNREYKSYFRKMILKVFKILPTERHEYRSHHILTVFEVLYQKFGFKGTEAPLETEVKEKIIKLGKTKGTAESVLKLENFFGGARVQIDDPSMRMPRRFYIERISRNSQIRSKHVIITCNGFTKELSPKSEDWQHFVNTYPLCEIHSVHYESQNPFGIVSTMLKLTNTVYKMVRQIVKPTQLADGTWGRAYQEATNTGKYLAHVIHKGEFYKDKVVSLVGHSLGTKVIASCLQELERLKCYDRVYEVLLMAGVVHKGDFNGTFPSVIAHELTSCHTDGDWVLRYVLKIADNSTDPIGLSPLVCKFANVRSEDCTEYIKDHFEYLKKAKKLCLRLGFNEDVSEESSRITLNQ